MANVKRHVTSINRTQKGLTVWPSGSNVAKRSMCSTALENSILRTSSSESVSQELLPVVDVDQAKQAWRDSGKVPE